jgi:hypothetical protein
MSAQTDRVAELLDLHKEDVAADLYAHFTNVSTATIDDKLGTLWNELARIDARNKRAGVVVSRPARS